MKTRLLYAALAVILASASQALAQGGIVGWSQKAPTCFRVPGSATSALTSGSVSFATTAHGHIGLVCSVQAIIGDPTTMNAFGMTFDNTNGFVGGVDQCAVRITYEKNPYAGLPLIDGSFATNGTAYSGRQTVESPIFTMPDFNNNYYDVFVYMTRNSGATCNPIVYATFVEDVIQ